MEPDVLRDLADEDNDIEVSSHFTSDFLEVLILVRWQAIFQTIVLVKKMIRKRCSQTNIIPMDIV